MVLTNEQKFVGFYPYNKNEVNDNLIYYQDKKMGFYDRLNGNFYDMDGYIMETPTIHEDRYDDDFDNDLEYLFLEWKNYSGNNDNEFGPSYYYYDINNKHYTYNSNLVILYCKNGILHNERGPAVITGTSYYDSILLEEYYINGIKMSKEEFDIFKIKNTFKKNKYFRKSLIMFRQGIDKPYRNYINMLKNYKEYLEINNDYLNNINYKEYEKLENEISILETKKRILNHRPKRKLPIIKHYSYLIQ